MRLKGNDLKQLRASQQLSQLCTIIHITTTTFTKKNATTKHTTYNCTHDTNKNTNATANIQRIATCTRITTTTITITTKTQAQLQTYTTYSYTHDTNKSIRLQLSRFIKWIKKRVGEGKTAVGTKEKTPNNYTHPISH